MINNGMMSSNTDQWETPQSLFDSLSNYNFQLDVCADQSNYKCKLYFTKEQDGLIQDWTLSDKKNNIEHFFIHLKQGSIWCNPPYGKEIGKWVKKAVETVLDKDVIVVMLLPARTDTKWFHDYIYEKDYSRIEFIKGRLKFGNSKNSAPFPSMLVYLNNERKH